MRISKLARNYNLSRQELTDYLESLQIPIQSLHPNAKLDDELIEKVSAHFQFSLDDESGDADTIASTIDTQEVEIEETNNEVSEEPISETEESTIEDPIEDELLDSTEAPEEIIEEQPFQEKNESEDEEIELPPPTDEEIILSDQLLEMIESEESPADLDKIRLIKAPKKELSGLKVVGKIEIPEDPRKKLKEEQ